MSGSKERQKRLDPSVLNTAFLDEIAERLYRIEKYIEEISPIGIVEPLTEITVTTTPSISTPPFADAGKYWFSVVIINDGPNSCWVVVNTGKSSDRPFQLKNDESREITFSKALIYDIRHYTDAGTAVLRITGTR